MVKLILDKAPESIMNLLHASIGKTVTLMKIHSNHITNDISFKVDDSCDNLSPKLITIDDVNETLLDEVKDKVPFALYPVTPVYLA